MSERLSVRIAGLEHYVACPDWGEQPNGHIGPCHKPECPACSLEDLVCAAEVVEGRLEAAEVVRDACVAENTGLYRRLEAAEMLLKVADEFNETKELYYLTFANFAEMPEVAKVLEERAALAGEET